MNAARWKIFEYNWLLNLRFFVIDVLHYDWIVLLKRKLLCLRPRILLGHIIMTRTSGTYQFDFLCLRLRHDTAPIATTELSD
jgi:hypothetical protein